MAGLYRDEAVVLRTTKLGEADRIVTMLTAETGKVRAVAKGVRRSGSRFGARLEPGNHIADAGTGSADASIFIVTSDPAHGERFDSIRMALEHQFRSLLHAR